MKKKNLNEKKGNSFVNLLVLTFMICFVGVVAVNCVSQMNVYYTLKEEEEKLNQSIQAEEKKKLELATRKDYYNSDAYIEKIAREQLGLIKANEILFINRAK